VARSDTVNVLIVDDDRSVQRVLADALTKQGFVVTVERDGEWAVKTFEKKAFDVVLLDLLLPALSGYEVAKKIRALPRGRRVPIIMISGVYKTPVHKQEAVAKHGAFALLEKPLDLKLLMGTLADALGERFPHPPKPKAPVPPPPPEEEDEKTGEFMADDAQREEVEVVERQSRQATHSTALTARGDLSQKPFPDVLAEIYRWRSTGALLLRRGKVKKIVYFRDGTPESVKSNLLVECLGRLLVREKMISEAECEESLKRMKATRRMQGTVLIEMGCISPHNLQHALVVQLQEKIYDCFRWDEGEYQFNPKVSLPADPLSIGLTCAQLINEGIKRTYDEKRLFRHFSGLDHQYVHPSEEPLYALQDAGLGEEERELLRLADGHKTLTTLRALGVLGPFETDRFFFAMRAAQMVAFKPTAAPGKPRVPLADLAAPVRAAPKPPPAPPPLPPPPPSLPPPLPARKAAHPSSPPLDLPWSDAKLAQPMARVDAPPPPPPPAPAPLQPPPKTKPAGQVLAKSAGSLLPELSEVVSLPRVTGQEGQAREKLAAKLNAMRKLDYFEILGVTRRATREEVKRAYFALAKEYHPDRAGSASAETRALAQQLYDLISTAHDTLADATERKRYVAELEAGAARADDGDVGKILAAEGKFQRGEELMRLRQYADAFKLFKEAIALYADEGEFHAWLGWALFQADPSRAEDALRSIEQAIVLNPRLDKAYLFLGYIHKATGRPDRAERQFEKAIQANPDCTEALRELRLLGKQRK
jgi:DNA-binding response OmpR family regulator/Flp pilus assembly protein TadD